MATWNPRANELFLKAMELRSFEERRVLLDLDCGADKALRAEVERLLEASDGAGSFLDRPAAAFDLSTVAVQRNEESTAAIGLEAAGSVIGPYKLLQQIGEGGMGTVYMAEQTHPVRRKVALKVIKPGMDSRQVVARFEAERQALAMMDHVNIARVLDAGATESGRPYFVMELVHGMPITKYCDDNQLTPRQRLELFVPVCQAIQHAHQKGIIHRDIKPSNVMITLYDGKPVAKVIDFGVAKATEQTLTERTLFTQYGTLVGTLEYMSPEQAEMSALGVDTRSDIYSLGVLLYELLTGSTPLSHKRVKESAFAEILRLIREEEPPRPSTRLTESGEALASISAQRQMEPARLAKLMRGELDWIVMKTLEKDRNRRYETASGFAADLQRYLDDEPVQACPPSALYRLRKFTRRNKRVLATGSLLGVMLFLGVVQLVINNLQLKEAQTLTDAQKGRAETALGKAKENLELADENLGLALEALDEVYMKEIDKRVDLKRSLQGDLTPTDREFLQKGLRFYELFGKRNSAQSGLQAATAKANRRAGYLLIELLQWQEAVDQFRKAIPPLEKFATQAPTSAEFRQELASSRHGLSVGLRNTGPLDEAETTCRLAVVSWQELVTESPENGSYRIWLAQSLWHLNEILTAEGRHRDAEVPARQALKAFEQLSLESPASTFYRQQTAYSHRNLANSLRDQGRLPEALEDYQRSLDLFAGLVDESPNDLHFHWQTELAGAHDVLGHALKESRHTKEAEAAYRHALSLRENLVEVAPKDVNYRKAVAFSLVNLQNFLADQGRHQDSEASARQALKLFDQPELDRSGETFYRQQAAYSHRNLANSLRAQGRLPEAVEGYRRSVALFAGLLAESPDDRNWLLELAQADVNLGHALRESRHTKEAETAFRQAVSLQEQLVQVAPKEVNYRKILASHLNNLADLVWASGRLPEAEQGYRGALLLYEQLLAEDRAEPEFWYLVARQNHGLGRLVQASGRPGDVKPIYEHSLQAYREALTRYERRAADSPSPEKLWQLVDWQGWMALAFRENDQPEEAIKVRRESVSVLAKLASESCLRDPLRLLAIEHSHLGELLNEIGRLQDSERAYSEALTVWKKLVADYNLPEDRASLATTEGKFAEVQAYGKLDEAIAGYRKKVELDPKSALAHNALGNALLGQKRRYEAIVCYRKAIELDPKYAAPHSNIGNALQQQGKLDEAIARYREAIEIDPRHANAYNGLGNCSKLQGKIDEAVLWYRKAIEIDPKHVHALMNLSYDLGNQGKFDEAIALSRKAIELDPKSVRARDALGRALGKKGWDLIARPDPKLRDPQRAVEIGQEAVELASESGMAWQNLGWIQYRTGNWKSSIEALEKSCKLQEGGLGDFAQWIVMSLAHEKLANVPELSEKERDQHKTEARRLYEQSVKQVGSRSWADTPFDRALQAFLAEGAELLGVKEEPK